MKTSRRPKRPEFAISLRGPQGQVVSAPVYAAATVVQRARGLMYREDLGAGTGMVFLFPKPIRGPFHMKNVRFPLSAAFFDERGEVLEVLDMAPCASPPCPRYDPRVQYQGALEVNQGFFDEIGLRKGWIVQLSNDLPPRGLPHLLRIPMILTTGVAILIWRWRARRRRATSSSLDLRYERR